ncbi:MAG: ABC transporter permease subunit [Thiotrichales bacterium]|nr:ABC transporter permease subunit [Thiotrichales bacterium]|tara:strand:+ start:881 stop:2377 length:1497 start_codon:yes stop_codon:yes gene_type:complete
MSKDNYINTDQIKDFVKTNPDYYIHEFEKINNTSKFVLSFNLFAFLFGSMWFGIRNIWNWSLAFLIIETFAIVQIIRGFFGNISAEAYSQIEKIQKQIGFREQQLQAAIDNNSDKVEMFKRTIKSFEDSIAGYLQEAQSIEASGVWIAISGIILFLFIRVAQGILANSILERRFSEWLSNKLISPGMEFKNYLLSISFALIIIIFSSVHYSFPNLVELFADFPTHPDIRLASIDGVERAFDYAVIKGDVLFSAITIGIRSVLDSLEMLFVTTPWIVVISAIVLMTGLSAGPRAALYSLSFLAYMGLLGFWIKAMTTLALLGTAAILSISIGIPLGIYCSTRPKFYAFIRPIMDFMQTMPAFVFMIPVIAFFGTGKVSAVIITMIFGGTPVVRLTVLGLKGVPESIREAAIAYGASKWYLLTKVDLPLAMPTILAGVNQTVMLSLAMVVVASLIGAKGLGQDVLEALQYANVGQGILAGIAILFCALILDRVIQGKKRD